MSLNPMGMTSNSNWNYSNPNNPGFSLELVGTVVSAQEVQARNWDMRTGRPSTPKFWDNGDPVWNIRLGFATETGELKTFTFSKAGKAQWNGEKPSVHMQLFRLLNDMNALIGKTVRIQTWPANPENGAAWGRGNPRLFNVELVPDVKYELAIPLPAELQVEKLYANDGASGGKPTGPAPQQIQVPQAPMPQMQGQYYPQQYGYQVPQQPVMATQPQMPLPVTAPMPAGMDPAVAAAMQAAGAVNVQPVGSIYDDQIPF